MLFRGGLLELLGFVGGTAFAVGGLLEGSSSSSEEAAAAAAAAVGASSFGSFFGSFFGLSPGSSCAFTFSFTFVVFLIVSSVAIASLYIYIYIYISIDRSMIDRLIIESNNKTNHYFAGLLLLTGYYRTARHERVSDRTNALANNSTGSHTEKAT